MDTGVRGCGPGGGLLNSVLSLILCILNAFYLRGDIYQKHKSRQTEVSLMCVLGSCPRNLRFLFHEGEGR